MEYRGIAYEITPGKRPATWHWTVHFSEQMTVSGQIIGKRRQAAEVAQKVIDATFRAPKPAHDNQSSLH